MKRSINCTNMRWQKSLKGPILATIFEQQISSKAMKVEGGHNERRCGKLRPNWFKTTGIQSILGPNPFSAEQSAERIEADPTVDFWLYCNYNRDSIQCYIYRRHRTYSHRELSNEQNMIKKGTLKCSLNVTFWELFPSILIRILDSTKKI